MTNRDTDTRICTLVDIPFIRRISDEAAVLDTELEYTRDVHGPSGAILTSILLPQRNLVTLMARVDKQQAVGQFRIDPSDQIAHIAYVAPHQLSHGDDTVLLHVFDAMAREAGKLEAQALVGEVDEFSPLFETMRHAGFAVYARQQVWRRLPGDYGRPEGAIRLETIDETTLGDAQGLVAQVVPRMLHSFVIPAEIPAGWLYRTGGKVQALMIVNEGRHGVYIQPYINPELMASAPAILQAAIQRLSKHDRLPVYVRIRRYQEWMTTTLEGMGFEPGPHQALMVRHIQARVRRAQYSLRQKVLNTIPSLIPYEDRGDRPRQQLTLTLDKGDYDGTTDYRRHRQAEGCPAALHQ
jgi:hypothetical protein